MKQNKGKDICAVVLFPQSGSSIEFLNKIKIPNGIDASLNLIIFNKTDKKKQLRLRLNENGYELYEKK